MLIEYPEALQTIHVFLDLGKDLSAKSFLNEDFSRSMLALEDNSFMLVQRVS